MGLREIARTVIQAQKQKYLVKQKDIDYDEGKEETNENERSFEYGSDLQERGRLSGTELADAAGAGGELGQIRRDEENLPQRVPQSVLHQSQDHMQADSAFGGGGENRQTEMISRMVRQMAEAEGVTENMKATDPMKWTGLMNNFRNSAEEIVLADLIYS